MSSKVEVIKKIEAAFDGVTLDGGISLDQTKVIDDYGRGCSGDQFSALPLKEVTDDWRNIPSSTLDETECLAFLDANGLRYYLPALMIRMLEAYDSGSMMTIGTISALDGRSQYNLERYTSLTSLQKAAIANYVKELPVLIDLDSADESIVERAFRDYWSNFLES